MRHITAFVLTGVCLTLTGCQTLTSTATSAKAPAAKIEPTELKKHGDVRVDNYYWLKDRDNPEVIEYLNAENEYTDQIMAHTKKFEEGLFEEIKARIKEDDASAPYRENGYWYYTRYEEGFEYPLHCRKKGTMDAAEEVMLNVNEMAEGHEFYAVRAVHVSENNDIVSYAVDTTGRRIYAIHFKNLATGETLPDVLEKVTANSAWANDNKTFFYAKQDEITLRYYRIYRHTLGEDAANDKLVFEEKDDTFGCYVWKTKSKKYMMIGSYQTLSSEIRYTDANNPTGEFTVFLPRERDHEYEIDHFKDKFYIYTNYKAKNFRLMETKVGKNAKANWKDAIPHRDDVLLESTELFSDFLAVKERRGGLTQIQIRPWQGEGHYLDFGEPTYDAGFGENHDMDSDVLRFVYTSMTTPSTDFDYNMNTREKTLIKREEVLGGFDPDNYITERLFATADDGTQVPMSVCYKKGMQKEGDNPVLLYGYGSYGYSMDANFRSYRYSLIDRGFIYVIAHIRGGQEMGRQWYEDGKLFNKKNTFTDFIACGKHLVAENYTNSNKLYAYGGSAGGLLVGAAINMAPELFDGAVAAVPFVDVITTMLDESIPLTTGEYDEWGNPNEKEYYDYILSYSPYDNVEAKDYPHLLITTGLHDSQVQYWEPAKWAARLRALKTDNNRLLLKTNMEAGHGGASGRFKRYKEIAFDYTFLLDLAGLTRDGV